MRRLVTVLVATLAMTSAWLGGRDRPAGRAASRRCASDAGVAATRRGDHAPDQLRRPGRATTFQYTGVPDGIGVYESAPDRLEVFTNHELSYRYGDPAWSRVSHLTLDAQGSRGVGELRGRRDRAVRVLLLFARWTTLDGAPWYFTGEEWFASPRGRHVDRDQRADGQGGRDAAVRLAEP